MELRDKVIKGLECHFHDSCIGCPYDNYTLDPGCIEHDIMADVFTLLKAQEPVEPIPTPDDDWVCGSCSKSVVGTEELDASGFVPVRFNFCPNCGRAVKWND